MAIVDERLREQKEKEAPQPRQVIRSVARPERTGHRSTPRILILMSDTGGGHRASAQALQAAFEERYAASFHVDIVDLWKDHTPWPFNQLPKVYGPIINRGVWFWKFLWTASERAWLTNSILWAVGLFVSKSLRQAFEHYTPDLVISVHPLMQQVPYESLRQMLRHVPFVTVVTDLATINPLWFYEEVDLCFVASDEARLRGLRAGMHPQQLRVYGLPVRPHFSRAPKGSNELKQQLGLDPDKLTVLLIGGGEGMGPVAKIAEAVARRLAKDGRNAQLAIVCGRNKKLQRLLRRRSWPIPVQVQGFVTNMAEWMAASDCIITKAGPGTIAEALISGLPILLSGYIPGQEEGNVPFVVENGVGAYTEDADEMAAIISRWFGPKKDELDEMARRARVLGKPQSTFEIVEEIAEMVGR